MKSIFKIILLLGVCLATLKASNRPTNLEVSFGYLEGNADTYTLLLDFEEADNAKEYIVYYKEISKDTDNNFAKLKSVYTNEMELSQVKAEYMGLSLTSKAYSFQVTAIDQSGEESEPSNIVSTACGRVYNVGDLEDFIDGEYSSIISSPDRDADVNKGYTYDVDVLQDRADNNLFNITYKLVEAPEGMKINETTGEISWTPETEGSYIVDIRTGVDGNFDNGGSQIYKLNVGSINSVIYDSDRNLSNVYPNPAYNEANFEWDESIITNSIMIFDQEGRTIQSEDIKSNKLNLNLTNYPSGKYFLKVNSKDGKELIIPFVKN